MNKRNKIVAANWKMNKTFDEAQDLVDEIIEKLPNNLETDVIICPPLVYTEYITDMAENAEEEKGVTFFTGAQNVSQFNDGAYTGEVSAKMLSELGTDFVIVGHSERRKYFGETDQVLAEKINRCFENDLSVIFCCGEQLEDREAGKHLDVVKNQIANALFHLTAEQMENIIIAYEPVWAIGTGKTATKEQAQEMHKFIRSLIEEKFGEETADNIYILYGGSCNADNALELFSQNDIDGGLIGGASLVADKFLKIISAAETCQKDN